MANPERDVIADIDALEAEWAAQDEVIDHNLTANRGFDDYHADWHDRSGKVLCVLCRKEWHGLQKDTCPGEYASESEKQVYRAMRDYRGSRDNPINIDTYIDGRPSRRGSNSPPRNHLSASALEETYEPLLPPVIMSPRMIAHDTDMVVTVASPEMQAALVDHVEAHPEDTDHLMRRFRSLIFAPDGRPVPWTDGGLRTVLGGNREHVEWARRQLGFVDLGAVGPNGVE